jgi:hypothetical protein
MAALEAAVQVKMAVTAEEKGNKQSARLRLIADPSISVKSIQAVLSKYVEFKQEKQLWSLVCPPASGPCSYGWHSKPDGQWLMKVAGLLYDLLAICPNTKLVSKKVVAALKAMQTSFVAEFPHTKYLSSSDLMDKVDVTLRVLLSMLHFQDALRLAHAEIGEALPPLSDVVLQKRIKHEGNSTIVEIMSFWQ